MTLKFKTNINCGGCLSRVTPTLDKIKEIESWEVDLQHADRILSVNTDSLAAQQVEDAIKSIGFSIEEI